VAVLLLLLLPNLLPATTVREIANVLIKHSA
jgi:hypothetical protein